MSDEKVVSPKVNKQAQSVSGTKTKEEVRKADFEASGEADQTITEANTGRFLTENFLDRPVTRNDGGYYQYEIMGVIKDDPVYKHITKILGLGPIAHTYQNEIKDIAEMAATWTQSDRSDILASFIKTLLRETDFDNSNEGSKIQNLRLKLFRMYENQKTKKGFKYVD